VYAAAWKLAYRRLPAQPGAKRIATGDWRFLPVTRKRLTRCGSNVADLVCHTGPERSYNLPMPALRTFPLALVLTVAAAAQQTVSISTDDGGQVCADLYGQGSSAVVLAHGGRFNKGSWHDQALSLRSAGYEVLAIDFRGFGCSKGPGQNDLDTAPFEKDVLAAVRYLKAHGAKTVSVVGGSFGGAAAGDASIKSAPGEIDLTPGRERWNRRRG